jgi:hypothetical protein
LPVLELSFCPVLERDVAVFVDRDSFRQFGFPLDALWFSIFVKKDGPMLHHQAIGDMRQ